MKRVIVILVLVCLFAWFSAALTEELTTISFDSELFSVAVDQNLSLKAIVTPKKKLLLSWSSSDETVATVTDKGMVKGISVGEAIITVKAADDENVAASCKISVVIPVNKIALQEKTIELAPGVSKKINIIVEPENATNKSLSYSSSNEKVAVVNEEGLVTGLMKGKAKITVTAKDGSNKKAAVNVNVQDYDMVFVSKRPQRTSYSFSGTGNVKIRGIVKNGNVEIKRIEYDPWSSTHVSEEIDEDLWFSGSSNQKVEVVPLHPGTDEVTIKVNRSKIHFSVYVADSFEDYEIQYVPVPDTKPGENNGAFRDIVYGTPYSDIVDQLIEEYGSDYKTSEKDVGCSIVFTNPGIKVAGHEVSSLDFQFCYDEDERGYIVSEAEKSCFYGASYIIRETSCEQDYLDDYILGDHSITEDLYNKLSEKYGKQGTSFNQNDVSDGQTIYWEDNQTSIELEYNNRNGEISLTYTWSPGYIKHSRLQETFDYLKGLEKQKEKDTEETDFEPSIDGL